MEPSNYLQSIRKLLSRMDYKISHVFREGNQAADFLANQTCNAQQLCIFPEDALPAVGVVIIAPRCSHCVAIPLWLFRSCAVVVLLLLATLFQLSAAATADGLFELYLLSAAALGLVAFE
ncbi:UNVERIFIED_CONTAM: hypothetical protein Sradi_7147000 [Sesamum radiatum]|uniref:RNase H type-1 domain-containing protein n=1 Tax=Sesamum radiatum TaxID=300843 RepID=A0AAW2IX52_SESRA